MDALKTKLIVISGGGTGGPSTAPLALAVAYRRLDATARFIFLGNSPELEKKLFGRIFEELGADYYALPAGKWRRYFSWSNFFDIFKIIFGFFKAYFLFRRLSPDLIVSAGSFASVPVVWAGKLNGAKIFIHQQDLRPGLANRLMSRAADCLSVAFSKSLADYGQRATLIGNPSLVAEISSNDKERVLVNFKLNDTAPLILVTGGGGGALALNRLFFSTVKLLPAGWQIVHQTGPGKGEEAPVRAGYRVVESISHEDYRALMSLADMVVSRAGLGALTELSLLAKPCLLIPIPHSHQEDNAAYFADNNAALVLNQETTSAESLANALKSLWQDDERRRLLSKNISHLLPADAADKGAALMYDLINA